MPPRAPAPDLDALIDRLLERARPARHLTEEDLAERWGLDANTLRKRRRGGGDMPPHLAITDGTTKQTIRYRLADVEAWEESRLQASA